LQLQSFAVVPVAKSIHNDTYDPLCDYHINPFINFVKKDMITIEEQYVCVEDYLSKEDYVKEEWKVEGVAVQVGDLVVVKEHEIMRADGTRVYVPKSRPRVLLGVQDYRYSGDFDGFKFKVNYNRHRNNCRGGVAHPSAVNVVIPEGRLRVEKVQNTAHR
jgi:hypothetical protein